ncbi:uncharacterized protein [Chelonus insularis]|uniref:uncharacterized protein isoform X2 n=1 Tax=Chelonus insularis TaxID=460826 RepID=UPI00158DDA3B|nr:uncharacterized protein LOC118066775 isoform X2 [Chelonus insularis]
MSLTFQSPVLDEHETKLMTGNLEERKEAFKEDEELMRETTKFITDVIETAASEASKRKLQNNDGVNEGSRLKGGNIIAGWNNRARGFCNRILNAVCPCFTNNELFAWTPYRFRFSRP